MLFLIGLEREKFCVVFILPKENQWVGDSEIAQIRKWEQREFPHVAETTSQRDELQRGERDEID